MNWLILGIQLTVTVITGIYFYSMLRAQRRSEHLLRFRDGGMFVTQSLAADVECLAQHRFRGAVEPPGISALAAAGVPQRDGAGTSTLPCGSSPRTGTWARPWTW